MDWFGKFMLERPRWVTALIILALVALPVAVWLDLRNLSDQALRLQATSLDSIISEIRAYYSRNVVARVQQSPGRTQTLDNYHDVPGAIPIPATLSIELGDVISKTEGNIAYRFVSDFPFANRPRHVLDSFETRALSTFRAPDGSARNLAVTSGSIFDRQIRIVTPVIMGASCVACHNSHPQSPKHDWSVGDVRGIQEITIQQPIAANAMSFKFLLAYFVLAGTFGLVFARAQARQAKSFRRMNRELEAGNEFLASISMKISKYLSPQIYKSIFSGEKDASISTERKKLTIFFSDIKDFTETTERLQPEELTALLNEYFTEMSAIALAHGATIDKFIGDAILAFFGDPETKGVVEDARACVRMALAMQTRLAELDAQWRSRGFEKPFKARMGINTGYCNVGNFGSADRMDYTIIGAEANLAARLESIAEPGGIVMSYETYALVQDMVSARPLEPTRIKGIARKVVPYAVHASALAPAAGPAVIEERVPGLSVFLNVETLDGTGLDRAREVLETALEAVARRRGAGA
jgi:class 3 adenylate cyclase